MTFALVAMLVRRTGSGRRCEALRTPRRRTKRRQLAEERAAKIGVSSSFLSSFLFPAFFVTLGPAVIQFINVFFGQIMGGG
jgi:hypothetical protein